MAMYQRESTLANSKLYQDMKNLTGENQTLKAIDLIKKSQAGSSTVKELTKEDIEGSYIQLKQYSNSLYRDALKAFDNGKVKLIYNSQPLSSINKAIPFLSFLVKDQWVSYVFADNYVVLNKRDGVINFPADRLRDLLIGGMIAASLRKNYSNLTTNSYLENILMTLYTKFICRILAKEYSVPSNKELYDKVQFWCNKFFLLKVFNSTSSDITSLAKKDIRYLDEMVINTINNEYDTANPESFEDLLNFMRDKHISLKSLNIGTFLNSWINYYYAPSLLALENIEYLIFMVIVLMHGTHSIVNIAAHSIVTETKNINSLNEELIKLQN